MLRIPLSFPMLFLLQRVTDPADDLPAVFRDPADGLSAAFLRPRCWTPDGQTERAQAMDWYDRQRSVRFVFCFNGATENDDQFSLPWTEYTSL